MKNLGLATIAAAGLMAAVLGFAGPANADIGHDDWVNDIQPTVVVPHVNRACNRATDERIEEEGHPETGALFLVLLESFQVPISANGRSISAIGINRLTSLFRPSEGTQRAHLKKEEGTEMKKFGFAGIAGFAVTGLAAAILGFAAPAQADVVHHDWIHEIQQQVNVPQVDMSVQHSR